MADINFTADAPKKTIQFSPDASNGSDYENALAEEGVQPGAGEALTSLATGAAASVPAGFTYLGTGGNVEKARAVQKALTYEPRSPEGQQVAGALSEGMAVPGKWASKQLDEIDPSGQLSAAASDIAERAGYATAPLALVGPVGAIRRGLTTESTISNFGRSEAPAKATPGPITAEQLQTGPVRLQTATPAAAEAAPATEAPALVPVPGKPHIRPKATPEPAPTAAEAAARIRAEEEPAAAAAPSAVGAPAAGLVAPVRDEAEISGVAPGQAEQSARLNAVRQLQDDTGAVMPSVRKSAVTGDYRETGTDYQLGELGDPTMRAQLDQENAALRAASQAQVDHAGGIARGVGQAALEQRGGVIDRALQGVGDWFDRQIRQTYQNADRAAGGVPMQKFDNLQGLLADHSQFTGVEGKQLHADIAQVAQQFGMMGQDGFWKPTTVATAERFRQWLGEQYSPRTGRTIARAKDALDADVSAHGGQGLYDAGRALRFKRDQMLEGPTGISRLMPEKMPDGRMINRPVPLEKIADHVTNLPREQFDHIVNVLHDSSKLGNGELAENNAAALNEIRRHMAERLHEAGTGGRDGMWNPYDYHEQLDHYSTKLPSVFSPEGIRRFNTIHDAGNALRLNKRYPGAAKQIMQAGGLRALAAPRIAGLLEGGLTGLLGPAGGAAAEVTGLAPALRKGVERVIGGNSEARQARQVGERLQPLSVGPGAKQRGGPKFENNASGESSASAEAQSRVRQETAAGRSRYQIDPDGNVTPLRGVDAVDAKAPAGHVIVQRGIGMEPYSVLDRGGLPSSQANGLVARAQGLGKLREAERANAPLGQTLFGGKQRGGPKFEPKPESAPFKEWFGKSQVRDPLGNPQKVYHGTTADFKTFDTERANPESDWGKGIYFTNDKDDVSHNYGGMGPDLTNKIEHRAEQLEQEGNPAIEGAEDPHAEAVRQAKEEFMQHQGAVIPAYVRMENPAVLGGKHETRFTHEYEYEDDDPEKDIVGDKGTLPDFMQALHDEATSGKYYDISKDALGNALSRILEQGDGAKLSDVIDAIENDKHENGALAYATDENGKLAGKEIIRAALERIGFDGIIDHTVNKKFGSEKRIGKAMEGMKPNTVHYIIFHPNQVKSAVGNSGAFSRTNPDITAKNNSQQQQTRAA